MTIYLTLAIVSIMTSIPPTADHFPDKNEFKRFVSKFIKERTASLKKDVGHCLTGTLAPFPAILYCMSTIDLLGALHAGQAKKKDPLTGAPVDTTGNSKSYMKEFMNYTQEQVDFIIDIFRHKLVHLAQPTPILMHDSKAVGWIYHHANTEKHLLLEEFPEGAYLTRKSDWKIKVDQYFNISIYDLMQDILDSVERHGGFLDRFESDIITQDKVKKAVQEIYEP